LLKSCAAIIKSLEGEQTCRCKTNQSLRNKMKSVYESVYVAVTSSGWHKGLPQKCVWSVDEKNPIASGLQT